MNISLRTLLHETAHFPARITILTGAGISAESGIPTFRGPEGYWTVGSAVYRPEEMATWAMFSRKPEEVWRWYLYRLGVCRGAEPNAGHRALVEMERLLGDRFTLITQNVDGLHLRAGNSRERTLEIHGNIGFMRCAVACDEAVYPLPDAALPAAESESPSLCDLPRCPKCGALARPHVLLFDECYNEAHYRFDSALTAAAQTDLLIVVGTSGATNLPNQVARTVFRRGGAIVDVNPNDNPFAELARKSERGFVCRGPAASILPELAAALAEAKRAG